MKPETKKRDATMLVIDKGGTFNVCCPVCGMSCTAELSNFEIEYRCGTTKWGFLRANEAHDVGYSSCCKECETEFEGSIHFPGLNVEIARKELK